MNNEINMNSTACSTNCKNDETPVEPPKKEIKWNELADSFLMIAFAVGVYSQIFAFFLYAFTV